MKRLKRVCSLVSFLLLALVCASGCSAFGRRGPNTVLAKAQADLHSGNPNMADAAALLLLSADTDSANRAVRKALGEGNSAVTRAAAIRAYTSENNTGIKEEMFAALGDREETIVELAKSYLAKVIGESAGGELLAIARRQDKPAANRVAALNVLGELGAAATVDGLIDILSNSEGEVADAAAGALLDITYQPFGTDAATWRLWYNGYKKYTPAQWRLLASSYYQQAEVLKGEIVTLEKKISDSQQESVAWCKRCVDMAVASQRYDVVIDVLAQATPVEAQVYAAEALGKARVAGAASKLEEKAKSSDPRLAKACINALGLIGDPAVTPTIEEILRKSSGAVKLAAIRAISSLPGANLSGLLPFLDDPSAEVKVEVAKAFGARKWAGAVEPLSDLLERAQPEPVEVRVAAVESLGEIGDKSVRVLLEGLTKDPDYKVRFASVRSLTMLADAASYDALLEATNDPVSGVREAAAVALGAIGDPRAVGRMLEMATKDPERTAADKAWSSLRQLAGSDAALILSLSKTLLQTDKAKAKTLLKDLADSSHNGPEVVESRRLLAKAYLEDANYEAARAYFQRLLDELPDDAEALSGITIALRNLGNLAGLATVYARQISGGKATPETRSYFLGVLSKLLGAGEYTTVAQCCRQVLAAVRGDDKQFAVSVREIEASALPEYLKTLVAATGGEEAGARAARDMLAGYGRAAAGALVGGLEAPSEATRTTCLALLKPLADGQTYGFDPGKRADEQQQSMAQWRAWTALTGPTE